MCGGLKGALYRSPNHSSDHDRKTVAGRRGGKKLTINRFRCPIIRIITRRWRNSASSLEEGAEPKQLWGQREVGVWQHFQIISSDERRRDAALQETLGAERKDLTRRKTKHHIREKKKKKVEEKQIISC